MKLIPSLAAAALLASLACQKQDELQKRVDDLARRVEALERRPAQQPGRPAGPDAASVYSVAIETGFERSHKPAKVTLVECSDYA